MKRKTQLKIAQKLDHIMINLGFLVMAILGYVCSLVSATSFFIAPSTSPEIKPLYIMASFIMILLSWFVFGVKANQYAKETQTKFSGWLGLSALFLYLSPWQTAVLHGTQFQFLNLQLGAMIFMLSMLAASILTNQKTLKTQREEE